MKLFFVTFLCLGLVAGCNSREEKGGDSRVSQTKFVQIQERILKPKCISCHSPSNPSDSIDVSSYKALLQSGVVIPQKPEASSFYTSLKSGKMPKGMERLSNEDLDLVYRWIQDGAGEVDTQVLPPPNHTFQTVFATTLEKKCVVCHNAQKPRGKTDLSSYEALMKSTGNKLVPVVPGQPEKSGLFTEIEEGKMPLKVKAVTAEEQAAVALWIERGALEVTPGAPPLPGPGEPNPPQPTYEWLSKNVFARRCNSCHGIPFKVAGIDFTNYATLMSSQSPMGKAIVPGDLEGSKVLETIKAGTMPPPPKTVSHEELELLKSWIKDGALKN